MGKSANPTITPISGGESYSNISSSAQISPIEGRLIGVFCASSASATLKLWDSTAASGSILVNTFTLYSGTWYPIPAKFGTGLYATITGTADITVIHS